MTIPEYITACHKNACEKGFHTQDNVDLDTALRNGDYKLFARLQKLQLMKDLALVMTEISEAVEHARKKDLLKVKQNWKESIEEELADTVIRIFDIAGQYNIDLEYFIKEKMEYNLGREYLHGKKL